MELSQISENAIHENKKSKAVFELTKPDKSLEKRILIAKKLFPVERKERMLAAAARDSHGRPVRYFRRMTYPQLRTFMRSEDHSVTESRYLKELFAKPEELKEKLEWFLEDQGLSETLGKAKEVLFSDFTPENYLRFFETRVPLKDLIHAQYRGLGCLHSLSVGVPFDTPVDPTATPNPDSATVLVEMVIPNDEVIVTPALRSWPALEMEKEVNTRILRASWISDVYQGEADFASRLSLDPSSPLFVLASKDDDPRRHAFSLLQETKKRVSIADLLPTDKLPEINEDNPKLQVPIVKL